MNHLGKYFTSYESQKPGNPRLSATYKQYQNEGKCTIIQTYKCTIVISLLKMRQLKQASAFTHTQTHTSQSLHAKEQR